ncbi:MAG: tryptophan--tRNA ligase [Candidatus Pacebacteria bacterium]|nr:tryptophan--tRNA ligase [Candidatus Paceibacterota bacterium]MDD5357133.1 tryptophan--tRNA ligase [Candidatus Paceibacterota bacterium]
MKKILLSGVKPTGRPHIGNFFGAMKQFVDLQENHESYIFIADLHALTTVQNKEEMSENIIGVALDYLAIGLDPKKVVLYKQSDVPQVAELGWIFNCLTTMPYLMRAHAFKDAEAKNKEINVGLFDYPLLMAADILIQDANVVPTGLDQKQHIEITRDTAEKFNRIFGDTFKMPEPLILDSVKVVPGIDGQKMSKSYNNTISLFASDEEIKKTVMGIVTDSSAGVPTNVYAIHSLIKDKASLDALYEEKKGKYKDLKDALIEDMIAFIKPMREKREALAKDKKAVIKILKEGGERARERAEAKMKIVREKIGVAL